MLTKIRVSIFYFLAFVCNGAFGIDATFCGSNSTQNSLSSGWLSGNWGVRVVLPGGKQTALTDRFASSKLIEQLNSLETAKWVMLNLSEPSFGGLFTAPNPMLANSVSNLMVPDVNLLGFYIRELKKSNKKVILYYASQGPSLNFLKRKRKKILSIRRPEFYKMISEVDVKWNLYLKSRGLTNEQGTADIIRYYSNYFGEDVDGWWFDHGQWGDSGSYIRAARSGNKKSVIAWNENHAVTFKGEKGPGNKVWLLSKSSPLADYTDGHISPTRFNPPWWKGNELLLNQVEECKSIDGLRAHLFVPLQSSWRAGKQLFPLSKAIDWTLRTISSGGGITWAAALKPPEWSYPEIWQPALNTLKSIDAAVKLYNRNDLSQLP